MNKIREKAIKFEADMYGVATNQFVDGFVNGYKQCKAETKADIIKECHYLLDCGMGKKKSIEHLILILEKEQENER